MLLEQPADFVGKCLKGRRISGLLKDLVRQESDKFGHKVQDSGKSTEFYVIHSKSIRNTRFVAQGMMPPL